MVREPIAAGRFYPDNPGDLSELIKSFIPKDTAKMSVKGLILPHAGYSYSGRVAVAAVSRILPKKKVIILGNNHSGIGSDFSLWPSGSWRILEKEIKIDHSLTKAILGKPGPIKEDLSAHQGEHSIEVELPILDYFFADFEFVPIACKVCKLESSQAAAEQIFQAIKNIKEEILLIASTDFTHYEPDAAVRRKDRIALEAIVALDEELLIDKVIEEDISICGLAGVVVLLQCLKKIGARKSQVILYQTSGDTGGDYSSVVGYAGITFK